MRRFPHFPYVGFHRYSLTFCTFRRRPLFVEPALVDVVWSQILLASADFNFMVLAYCFMPDHLHLLVEATEVSAELPAFVKRAKQRSGYHGQRVAGNRIWQVGYFERVLREADDGKEVAAYIVANPLRAGLVEAPENYPFMGSGTYTRAQLLEFVRTYGSARVRGDEPGCLRPT